MTKILFIADVPINNPISGAEQVINKQAVGLSEDGLDVFAVVRKNGKRNSIRSRDILGIKELCYFANPENYFQFFLSLLKKPDKIYAQISINDPFFITICHQPFTFFALLVRRRLKNTTSIYVFHSPNHEEYLISRKDKNLIKRSSQAWIRKLMERYCIRRSQKIVVLSEYMKKKLIKIHNIHHEKITVIPGGVDLQRFFPPQNRTDLIKTLGLPSKKLNLLTVRNLEPRMGLDNLLKAVCLLKQKGIDFHLVVGGEGPEGKNLEGLIKRKNLENNVRLIGFIPEEKLPQYYGAADFFILPSRDLEGFGLVTVESLACGTPVLGTPVGGTKEILAKLHPDFLFAGASPESMAAGICNAFNKIYQDTEKYCQIRQQCHEYAVENYSWQRHILQLKSIIDELSPKNELAN